MKTLLQAGWVAPMHGPTLRDGAVVFEQGRIVAVGNAREMRTAWPDAQVEDLGAALLMPGLVNAHTHLELSDCQRGDRPPENLASWLRQIIIRIARDPDEVQRSVTQAIETGVKQCLRFGVTSMGDITRHPQISRKQLQRFPVLVVSYGEVQAMGKRRGLLDERLEVALDQADTTGRLQVGLTPHAPYTVEPPAYARCLSIAQQRKLPLATHLAETADEAMFLAEHAGPFRELWEFLGFWDEHVPRFAGGPIRLAKVLGLLDYPTLLAHVNYCDDEELAMLAAGRAGVVYNPRTHQWFGHRAHRWREMLARGINVAVGTDSCASSPDLNIVAELRLLHRLAPETPAEDLWAMATIRAARAIGMHERIGSLEPGKEADLVAFAARGDDPLTDVLESDSVPNRVWIGGQAI